MRNRRFTMAMITAAGLAIGALAPLPIFAEEQEQAGPSQSVTRRDQQDQQQNQRQDQQQAQDRQLQRSDRDSSQRPHADQEAIHSLLSRATEALVSAEGGAAPLSQLMELVAKSDRQRLQGSERQQQARGDDVGDQPRGDGLAELEQKVRQFRQDWQAKYGGEFNLEDEQVVFSGVRIHSSSPVRSGDDAGDTATAAGDVETDAARQAGAQIPAGETKRSGSLNAERPGDRQEGKGKEAGQAEPVTKSGEVQVGKAARQGEIPSDGKAGDDSDVASNREQGDAEQASAGATASRDALTVMIPANRGAAEAHLRLKREGDGWKIDLPDAMTRERLTANLARHLGEIQQQKDNWAEEQSDAYKMVSHQILLALTDTALKPSPERDNPDRDNQEESR